MANVNPAQMEKCLKGLNYPASKMEVVSCAKRNGADKQICEMLERLPEQKYQHTADVCQAINTLEHRGTH